MRFVRIWLIFAGVFALGIDRGALAADVEAPVPGRTGNYVVKLTERSPLSSLKELAARFNEKSLGPDYDLGSQQFHVHVPASYDPAKPLGRRVERNNRTWRFFQRR